jgi:hypothetical protein
VQSDGVVVDGIHVAGLQSAGSGKGIGRLTRTLQLHQRAPQVRLRSDIRALQPHRRLQFLNSCLRLIKLQVCSPKVCMGYRLLGSQLCCSTKERERTLGIPSFGVETTGSLLHDI